MSEEGGEPTLARLRLAVLFREAREAAGLTQPEAARALEKGSGSKISRIESALLPVGYEDAEELLNLYRVTSTSRREQAFALARASRSRGPWAAFTSRVPAGARKALAVEAAASRLLIFDVAIPPVLQTPDYEEALLSRWRLRDAEQPDELRRGRGGLDTEVLARRREIIGQRRPILWMVLDEAVLTRAPGGGKAILESQLDSLITMAEATNIVIQILPADSELSPTPAGPFSILRIQEHGVEIRVPDMVIVEHQTSITLLESQEDADHYNVAFNRLTFAAKQPDPSKEALANALQVLRSGQGPS